MTHFNPSSDHSSSSKFSLPARTMLAEQQQLEKLYRLPHPRNVSAFEPSTGLKNGLQKLSQQLMRFLTGAQQVRIWAKETSTGKIWFAYDPSLDRSISGVSEDDLRTWLEERYRH